MSSDSHTTNEQTPRTAVATDLFRRNRAWAADRTRVNPDYFKRLADIQRPDYLWIGCADSRVPANEIVGLAPGELFVHRNVANVVNHADANCSAVLAYAIGTLEIRHVIVCGHYRCGGIKAALDGTASGIVGEWLAACRVLALTHREELEALENDAARWARLCELNVRQQVGQVAATTIVQEAWKAGTPLSIHGWIYDVADGLLHDLELTVDSIEKYRSLKSEV